MGAPRLVYLGTVDLGGDAPVVSLRWEGRELLPGTAIELRRQRSPWGSGQEVERVIIGSHPTRADVLLEGAGIHPEHARLYLRSGAGPADLWPLHDGAASLGGAPLAALAWAALRDGDEVAFGPHRFRFAAGTADGERLA